MRPAAALATLTLTSAVVIGAGGAADAVPSATPPALSGTSTTAGRSAPAEVTIEWVNQGAYGGGTEGVTPEDAPSFQPLTVTVGPAGAEGSVHFVAVGSGVEFDLGLQPVADGEAVAPTWVLPGGRVEGDTSYAEWYGISAEFVPDDPSAFQGAVPEREVFGWVQFGNRDL
ncbi:hypothetical protein GCM10028784_26600 [Myceligenerans cantabricum]